MTNTLLKPGRDMMYRINTEGRFLYVNQALALYFKSEASELIGQSYLSLIEPAYQQKTQDFYRQQLQEKQRSTYFEFPLKGSQIWCGQTVELILDSEGEVVELIGILQDISEANQVKVDLDQSDIRLNSLIQNMDVAILMEDEFRRVKYVNQTFCDLFGIPLKSEELIGADCSQAAEQSKHLFTNPEEFVSGVNTILKNRNKISSELLYFKDERVLERDYVPVFIGDEYRGHTWYYRDVTMQNLATMSIKESERKYREIIENIDLGLMEVDSDQNIIWANEPFLKSMGYTLDEIKGKNAKTHFIREEELAQKEPKLDDINEERLKGGSGVYELKLKNKESEDVWMLISGTPIFNENHKVKGSLGIHHNITHIKELQFQTEYRAKLQSILLDLSNQIIDLEPESEDEIINSALLRIGSFVGADRSYIFDYNFESKTCSNTYEYCAEDISPEIDNLQDLPIEALDDWLDIHQDGKVMIYENVQSLPEESSIRQILEPQGIKSIITVPIIAGKSLLGFIGFDSVKQYKAWNETEIELLTFLAQLLANHYSRKFFELKLSDSEAKLRSILSNAMDAIVTINEEGLVEDWNLQAENIFGFGAEEALGKDLTNLIIPHKYRSAHHQGMQHFLKTGEGPVLNNRIELVALSKQEMHFPVELSIIPIKLKDKYIFSAFLRDITQRKKAEDDMSIALEQSNELARMKSRLMSMASHEFRTPLTTIKANAEMLEYWSGSLEEKDKTKATRYISRMLGEVDRLTNIMNDMLVIGRLESGKTKVQKRMTDLVHLSSEIINKNFSNESDGRQVKLKIEGSPYLVPVDTNIIEHILNNLISNALKYSPNAKAPLLIINFKHEKQLRFTVKDFGLGIPEDEINSVFNAFYRSENTRQIKGTGMGLAIVKQFADIHKIRIKVFSAVNVGSEFVLEIDRD
jgi:PAS domain S-box-containing protein